MDRTGWPVSGRVLFRKDWSMVESDGVGKVSFLVVGAVQVEDPELFFEVRFQGVDVLSTVAYNPLESWSITVDGVVYPSSVLDWSARGTVTAQGLLSMVYS